MGNLKIKGLEKCKPTKLNINSPEIRKIIKQTIKEQEAALKLKNIDLKSMELVVTI